jgi:hypothetical protein
MKKIDDLRYQAEDDMTFVNKTTGVRYGRRIYLGADTIDNYEELPLTEDELAELTRIDEEVKKREETQRKTR